MKKLYSILMALVILAPLCRDLNISAQSLEVTGSLFIPQDSIGFNYSSPDFDSADWIGIYFITDEPGGPPSVVWDYIPSESGTLYLPAPGETGTYKAFLLCCDGYDTIAISGTFEVVVPVLTSSLPVYVQGDSLVFDYVSPKFSESDWIGIYPSGTKPGDENPSIDWDYLADSAGTMVFKTTLDPGTYDAYLLCCDGYDSLAAVTFEIIDAGVAFVTPKTLVFEAGSPMEFSFNDPQYATGDWLGIYFEGDDPQLVSSVEWTYVSEVTGTVTLPGTLAGGTYFAALFCCETSDTEYARSDVFTVQAGAAGTYIKTTASVYPSESKVIVAYRDVDWEELDWIGIYPDGINPGDEEATAWEYAESDSGTLEFDALEAGDWVVYLLCCDGYNIKAKYDFKVSDDYPSVVASALSYAPTDSLVFYYNSPTWTDTDWIGIYNPGDVPGEINSITWFYIPEISGTLIFRYPDNHELPPGEYWAGLFCCDGYDKLAETAFFIGEDEEPTVIIPPDSPDGVVVFPNPGDGNFIVRTAKEDRLENIRVFNLTGAIMYQESLKGIQETRLNLSSFNKGVYFLEVVTGQTRKSIKLVIR